MNTFYRITQVYKEKSRSNTKLEQWLWLIAGREEKVKMSKLDNPEVKKAMKLVEEILSDPKEREILDAREIARLDYNSDIAYAEEKRNEERT